MQQPVGIVGRVLRALPTDPSDQIDVMAKIIVDNYKSIVGFS